MPQDDTDSSNSSQVQEYGQKSGQTGNSQIRARFWESPSYSVIVASIYEGFGVLSVSITFQVCVVPYVE